MHRASLGLIQIKIKAANTLVSILHRSVLFLLALDQIITVDKGIFFE